MTMHTGKQLFAIFGLTVAIPLLTGVLAIHNAGERGPGAQEISHHSAQVLAITGDHNHLLSDRFSTSQGMLISTLFKEGERVKTNHSRYAEDLVQLRENASEGAAHTVDAKFRDPANTGTLDTLDQAAEEHATLYNLFKKGDLKQAHSFYFDNVRPHASSSHGAATNLGQGNTFIVVARANEDSAFLAPVPYTSENDPGCLSPKAVASTDRPTYTNSTETTQCGVLELIGGSDRVWVGHSLHQDDFAQGLQLGVTRSMDLHYSGNIFFNDGNHSDSLSGMSDSYAGVRYRFMGQSRYVPSLGTFYTTKVPTASTAFGMSTGRYDHFFSLLMSKDLRKLHLDFNLTQQLTGRPKLKGYDHNQAIALSASIPVSNNLAFVGGAYGFNARNISTPGYGVATIGFDWQVAHRLILDVSMDEGLTAGAPRKRLGFGFTYAAANLYALLVSPLDKVR